MDQLKAKIRNIPDFPKPGILFYDITTLLRDGEGFRQAIDALADAVQGAGDRRGRRHGEPRLHLRRRGGGPTGAGFIPVRKPGKLPSKTVKATYDLEYGSDCLEMHCDAVERGTRVAGRRRPAGDRRHRQGHRRRSCKGRAPTSSASPFLIELVELGGRAQLAGEKVTAVLQY